MNSTPPYSSNRFDIPDIDEHDLVCVECGLHWHDCACEDFWWDEEERHELF